MVRSVLNGGLSYSAAAFQFHTTAKTVGKWVKRFERKAFVVCATAHPAHIPRAAKRHHPSAQSLKHCGASVIPGNKSRLKSRFRQLLSAVFYVGWH